ncbi:MAG TPA: AarF/UbiB family protein [Thermoanaerobaculia bacterium]|nr:AarF/UbiB family protein [Thermoanaerobaculia bacterium]
MAEPVREPLAEAAAETGAAPGAVSVPAAEPVPESSAMPGYEILPDVPPEGLVRRFFVIHRHLVGLTFGGLNVYVREHRAPTARRFRLLYRLAALLAWLSRPFVNQALVDRPFPVQLRRRLEMLGPTYIKLGQVLALRQDLLPQAITDELKNLLDRLPVVPFPRYLGLIVKDTRRPIAEMYTWVDPQPTGSASIAQIHRATTLAGDSVIIKVVKPGIRETLARDAILLKLLGSALQRLLPRYQPKRVIAEFVEYTRREVDLRREADNAETFAANFSDLDGVHFPRIYREYSSQGVLCMEFLAGFKPNAPEALALPEEDRDKLVDLGAASIIRMLFKDGFFHADLHPGNLLVLPGPQIGFIDLGMVGRFDQRLRRTLLNYYYSLVMGDAEGAARYLGNVAEPGPGADPVGFRREVTEILQRWNRAANFRDFSLAQLILYSVNLGAQHAMYFPVEMVLMVKALVTFEGVGQILKPGLDVAAVSQSHARKIFLDQFNPLTLGREGMQALPELLEAVSKAPALITEGLRLLEQTLRRRPENPFAGLRGTIFGGFCLLAGAVLAGAHGPWPVWEGLFLLGGAMALHKG